jgi:inner membrane protein
MIQEPPTFFERANRWLRESITVKLVSIGFLLLLLLIPSFMIESLINERDGLRSLAIGEVSSKWGNQQSVTALVLTVPYLTTVTNELGQLTQTTAYAHFLPDKVDVKGELFPETRYRGIYEVVVYRSELAVSGLMPQPDFSEWSIAPEKILWKDAFVSLGVSDMQGIKESIGLQWNNQQLAFGPGIETNDVIESGVSVRTPLPAPTGARDSTGGFRFSFKLNLNGSTLLYFAPLGKETTVSLASKWPSPSFGGAALPDQRQVTADGFQAQWRRLHLNRNYPQKNRGVMGPQVRQSEFGVELMVPVDQYQKSTRAVKYAILILGLTFMVFFFAEVLNKRRIHPFQYILVGLALCIFYTLLVSLSEHFGFNVAYLLSALAVVVLVTAYCTSVFANGRLALLTGGVLALLYGFMYTLLQLEDYALLMGSVGLFVVLAVIMYLSRQIDWYGEKAQARG